MYLGLDVGTSAVKGLLIRPDCSIVSSFDAALTVDRPQPGWSEQDPADWIEACSTVVARIAQDHPNEWRSLQAIGLSGQMHGAVLLDADDRPIRPCILWNDGRSHAECAELEAMADFRGIAGNIVMAGFTAPKLNWVAKHEPGNFDRIRKVLLPKDYVRLWLTGSHVADMSDAAGTLWLDVEKRAWSGDLLKASGLTSDQMPDLVEGSDVSGHLRGELAAEWGIPSVPVAGGGGDNAATACGMGVLAPGTGFLSLGTSGVLFAACERFVPNTDEAVHTFCHAVPETWHQMGVTLAAVDSLNWLAAITGSTAPDLAVDLPDRITAPSDVLFLPYLSGERTPHNDPLATGAFVNLTIGTKTADLTQAVMEGVGFAFADCNDALANAGSRIDTAFAVGGGARSGQWLQMIAAITGITLQVPKSGDYGAAFGAAKLAVASTAPDRRDAVFAPPSVEQEIRPDPDLAGRYAEQRQKFRATFHALR